VKFIERSFNKELPRAFWLPFCCKKHSKTTRL